MKAAIITFSKAYNYGSALQMYALQKKVEELLDCECEVIDYYPPNQEEMYTQYIKCNSLKSMIVNIAGCIYGKNILSRREKFESFYKKYIHFTKKEYRDTETLNEINGKYDLYISGGDQVWNVNLIDSSEAYFYPMVKNAIKMSYAPSLGGGRFDFKNEEIKERVKSYINDYDFISVREHKGRDAAAELAEQKEVVSVLDPTFLLSREEWNEVASDYKRKEEYIFFYSINYDTTVIDMVKKISKKLGLPVVILYTARKTSKTFFSGFELEKHNAPEDFLSLIKNAKLVLTNSFHGTAFSIIYRKSFYVLRGMYGKKINDDDRMSTILEKLEIKNREITVNTFDSAEYSFEMDYSQIEERIEKEIELSKDFIKQAKDLWRSQNEHNM